MYQVLIADDELSVLKSLMDGIQWEELGLTVAAAVNNGEEALQGAGKSAADPDQRICGIFLC